MQNVILALIQEAGSSYAVFWRSLTTDLSSKGLLWLTVIGVLFAGLLIRFAPHKKRQIRGALIPLALYILLQFISLALLVRDHKTAADYTNLAATVMLYMAYINMGSIFLFDVIVPAVNLTVPRILRDTSIILAYVISGIMLLSARGVNIAGIITTSAILTAVIGLSLQDTLGNIIAGFALQIESIIKPGDWVKIDQHIGKVKEIHWRQTSIETRNWDLILIPNSQLMKGQVMIYGRRQGQPLQTRRWLYFDVGTNFAPSEVIARVQEALQSAPIENVALEPKINCILMDFKEGVCHYAVRYWLTDLVPDDPTDSSVRVRIYFALKRAGIPIALPTRNIYLTEDNNKRRLRKREQEMENRLEALRRVELLQTMTQDEQRALAERLRYAPFARGEVLTKQGAEAHWLYIITTGEAAVRVAVNSANGGSPGSISSPGNISGSLLGGGGSNAVVTTTGSLAEKEVARLKAGDFFGEMSLMTGAARSATVIALEDTECYRLDKEAFQSILVARPEIAEDISHVLARRRVELDAAVKGLDSEASQRHMQETQNNILNAISKFFGL